MGNDEMNPKENVSELAVVDGGFQPVAVQSQMTPGMIEQYVQSLKTLRKSIMNELKDGKDYYQFDNMDKPALGKSGAEKIAFFMALTPRFIGNDLDAINKAVIPPGIDDRYPRGYFALNVQCHLYRGDFKVSEGAASISSEERNYKSRLEREYTNRRTGEIYHINIHDLTNTMIKMVQKRAYIDATIRSCGLSDLYTQDLEEMPHVTDEAAQRGRRSHGGGGGKSAKMAEAITDKQLAYLKTLLSKAGITPEMMSWASGVAIEDFGREDAEDLYYAGLATLTKGSAGSMITQLKNTGKLTMRGEPARVIPDDKSEDSGESETADGDFD